MDLVGESGRRERAEHIAYITESEPKPFGDGAPLFEPSFFFIYLFIPQNDAYLRDPGSHLCVVGDQWSPANGAT